MSAPLPFSSAMLDEVEATTERGRVPEPAPRTSSTGRWWFAFDRWLAVSESSEPEQEFMLA
jgi:hypothetical protein